MMTTMKFVLIALCCFLVAAQNSAYARARVKGRAVFVSYTSQQTRKHGMPTMRDFLDLTQSYPYATQFRIVFDYDLTLGRGFHDEIFFDRSRKQLRLLGRNWIQGDQHFLYSGVTIDRLKRAIRMEYKRGYRGNDSNFSLLAGAGCHATDLHKGKSISFENLEEICF